MLIDHNGYRFAVDGMEWRDSTSKDAALRVLEDWVRSLGADDTARLHADLLQFNFEPDAKPSELVEQAMQLSEQANAKALGGLSIDPDTSRLNLSAMKA